MTMTRSRPTCVATLWCGLLSLPVAQNAQAQSAIAIYGDIDQYLNYMRSSSGATVKSLQDGAYLRSRLGVRGTELVDSDLSIRFTLESGFGSDTGRSADTSRFFDRQTWVGLASRTYGELRIGRQNTTVFTRGDLDFTARTLGSIINNFGVPSRYSNDVSWTSPVWQGWRAELHFAPGETSSSLGSQAVYQVAVDYSHGPYNVNVATVRGRPPHDAPVQKTISYDNVNAHYAYGRGKVYLSHVRSNNITATAAGNTAGNLLGSTGVLVTGDASTPADADRYYELWQLSADYHLTPRLRVGGLWGRIIDTSHSGHDAQGGALGAFYALSTRTTVYTLAETMSNAQNAGFRPSGSAGLNPNFSASDVNGQRMEGVQLGVLHRF